MSLLKVKINGQWVIVGKGLQGIQGPKGEQGATGSQGPQGIQGERGEQGNDYVLTDKDRTEIAEKAANLIDKEDLGLENVTNDAQVKRSEMGVSNGVATLDSNGHVPSTQLPSYVDDVIEGYVNGDKTAFYSDEGKTKLITAESGKIYTDITSLKTYRWGGTKYAEISESLALGETSTTAFAGDKGKIAYDHSQSTHAPTDALSKSGGTMTGEIEIGQGDGKGIQLGTNGRINATVGTNTSATMFGVANGNYYLGHSGFRTLMRGSTTRPSYNNKDLALYSDIPSGLPTCDTSNNGQFLMVVNGVPTWTTVPNAEGVEF